MKFKYNIGILLFLSLGLPGAMAQRPVLIDEVKASIEKRIDLGQHQSIVVGLINANGKNFYSFGKTRKDGLDVDENTLYEIGSITKVFTGILLAKQVIDGEVKLDDPVEKYLPEGLEVPHMGSLEVTLGHLSDHTSGLPRLPSNFNPANPNNPYVDYSEAQLLEFVTTYKPTRPVGSQYEYSNLAQGFLGYVLALNQKTTYEALLQKALTGPLDMGQTGITLHDKMREKLAPGHNNGREVENWDLSTLAGAGGIRSSATDMVKFLEANLGLRNSDLQPAMQLAMAKRHDRAGAGVALGWHLATKGDTTAFWHNGGTGGYRAYAGVVPAQKLGVVVLTNSTTSVDDIGAYLLGLSTSLREVKPLLANEIANRIDGEGFRNAWTFFNEVKEGGLEAYDASENSLNNLGYDYLEKDIDAALAVFKMNIELYPESFNVYDSYGEALLKKGSSTAAIENYKKSIELNPGNTNGIEVLKSLGVAAGPADVEVPESVLDSYLGIYAVQPTFKIEITREGSRLFGQATGQPRFEMFPKNEREFYLKAVAAQIVFDVVDGKVPSFTLYQNGAEIKAIKE